MSQTASQIQERVARWNATGIAHHLWPEASPQQLDTAHTLIWQTAAEVLAGRPASHVTLPSGTTTDGLGIAATFSGLGPLIGYWIEQGRASASPPLYDLFFRHLDHGRRRAAVLAEHLSRTLRELQRAGVDPILLKGAHTSRVYFPCAGTRPATDLDLLVHPDQLPQARRALSSIGLVRSQSPPSEHAEAWHDQTPEATHALDVDHADNPWQVDLHTSIDRTYFRGRATGFADLPFEHTAPIDVAGLTARVLRQPLLLAHLAQHTARDFYRFRLLRTVELIFVIRRDLERGLDFDELLNLLDRVRATRFVLPAFAFVERLVPGTVEPSFRDAIHRAAAPRLRAAVHRALSEPLRGYFRRSPDERLMWSRGWVEWIQAVSDIVWPQGKTIPQRLSVLRRRARMLGGGAFTRS